MIKIVDLAGLSAPQTFEIADGGRMVIGRDEGCDVVVSADAVSRRHAELFQHNGRIEVADLQSSNGTKIDGASITKAVWSNGQTLEIGPARFMFEVDAAEQPTVVSRPVPSVDEGAIEAQVPNARKRAETAPPSDTSKANFVVRHWRGESNLVQSILVNTLIVGIIYIFILALVVPAIAESLSSGGRQVLTYLGSAILLVLPVWQLVGVVRALRKSQAVAFIRWPLWLFPLLIVSFGVIVVFFLIGTIHRVDQANRTTTSDGQPVYTLTRRGNVLVFNGDVVSSIVQDFRAQLADNPNIRFVSLSSRGGAVIAARRVNDMLRPLGLTTIVTDFCHSACTLIYAAGQRRLVHANAKIGFHATALILMDDMMTRIMNALTLRQDRLNADYYIDAGFDRNFVERALMTPSRDLLVLSNTQLRRFGVVTEIVRR